MTYPEVIDRLFARRPSVPKSKLETASLFAESLGHPEKAFPTIHVAGTNGKGSVSLKVATALEGCGMKVGLFISPHVTSFRERISINGVQISEERVKVGLFNLFTLTEKIDPTACFFELTTFLAFQYFQEEKVDVAVIEAGIGGLYDTTNIIFPLISIITSIGYDHTEILGSTLEAIATQKAGIIKPKIPVVIGPHANYSAIYARAEECRSSVFLTEATPGFYDWENSAIAHQALQLLKSHFPLTEEVIQQGLKVRPLCRFEQIGNVILDVAHNPDGFCRLLEAMESHYPGKPFSVILGMCKDKDLKTSLKLLTQKATYIFLVEGTAPRAARVEEMEAILIDLDYFHFTTHKTPVEVIQSTHDGIILVCGTHLIMQEVRQYVLRVQVGSK